MLNLPDALRENVASDEERLRRKRLADAILPWVSRAAIGICILSGGTLVFSFSLQLLAYTLAAGLVAVSFLVYRWLSQRDRFEVGVYAVLLSAVFIIYLAPLLIEGPLRAAAAGSAVLIIIGAMLIGPRASLGLAAICIALYLGDNALIAIGVVTPLSLGTVFSMILSSVTSAVALGMTGLLTWLATSGLSQALNESRNRLQENELLIGQLQETADRLAPTAEELSALMEEMSASAEQVSSTAGEMTKGAETQASQMEVVSKSIEQMASLTGEIATSAETADAASAQAKDMVNDSVQALRKLSERAQEIGKIVEIVDKFADQTNLLALNAAIEAARAGEHGKGFAVVADEVRRLAENSSRSVGEIAELSEGIQRETDRVLGSMDRVIQAVERTADLAQGISQATSQQRGSSEMIVGSTNELATMAEENAAGAEETAAAIEEQMVSMEQIATSAQELAEMAARLQETVTKFGAN